MNLADNYPPHSQSQHSNDEIDLGTLFRSIWATRVRVVLSVLVVTVVFALYVGLNYFKSHKTIRYSNIFSLNFDGLSSGKFPNGSVFEINDILNNMVLNRVYQQNRLEDYGIKLSEFRRAVNIQPYAPNADFIREKYRNLLADKKLTAVQVAEIEAELELELKTARSSSVQLKMILPQGQSLTKDIAEKVLLDISTVWADRAINELGVLKPELAIYSERIFDPVRFENLDYLLGIDLITNSIALVRANIQELQKQPNAATLVDDESGFTLADLDKAIKDIADYDIRQIVDPIDELGIARDESVVRLHYARRFADLGQEKKMWQERARAIRTVLKAYGSELDSQNGLIGTSSNQHSLVPQLGDAFLDRLLEVSRQGSDLEFRQKLTMEMLDFENKSIDIDQEIATVTRTLETMNSTTLQTVNSTDQISDTLMLRDSYIMLVEEQLPRALEQLREYTRIMNRLYQKQGHLQAGSVSQLISVEGGSYEVHTDKIITLAQLKIFAVLMVLTVLVTVFLCMVRDYMRSDSV